MGYDRIKAVVEKASIVGTPRLELTYAEQSTFLVLLRNVSRRRVFKIFIERGWHGCKTDPMQSKSLYFS